MKVLFVNPPNGLYDPKYLAPPLGLLTLASVVRQHDHEAALLDLNLEVISNPAMDNADFYDVALNMIAREQADVVGFTSMCLESHVSLELARRIKEKFVNVRTIFGGTHFGAIANATLETFPFVDYVVAGEGEDALEAVLQRLTNGGGRLPSNVWHRELDTVVAGTSIPMKCSLEELPFPAYDLIDLQRYFSLNPNRLLNYEAGRGCVFKCSFCYSPFQYGDAVRNKQPDRVVEDLRRLSELGANHVFFVQDNLLNSSGWASDLCDKLAAARLPLTWECYATHPQLKEEIIDSLASAGCVGVFTGIDAVTPESQTRMNKSFLKSWEATSSKLSYCREKGILPICAFILEGPTQAGNQIDATINTAIKCLNIGCEVHLNTLSLYNNTTLANCDTGRSRSYSQIKSELLLDTPAVVQSNSFAKQTPHLFPYHSTHDDVKEWERFITKVYTLLSLIIGLRKTSYRYSLEEGNSIWETLAYVDDELVERIKGTPVPGRRLEALLRFVESFECYSLSMQTRTHLRREQARLVLAARETPRIVTLRVGRAVDSYFLGWFITLSESSDITTTVMLESGSELGFPAPSDPATFELALRSRNDAIRLYVVDRKKLRLLLHLLKASADCSQLPISTKTVLKLEEEGWIWPAGTARVCRSGLHNGAVST